jgi:hypothetical protein
MTRRNPARLNLANPPEYPSHTARQILGARLREGFPNLVDDN